MPKKRPSCIITFWHVNTAFYLNRLGLASMISVIVLAAVFVLIAIRRIGRYRLQIWQIMLLGAAAVLISAQISPVEALRSINLDVIFFLFGVFIIGQALEESGYLSYVSRRLFSRAGSLDKLVLLILLGAGTLSAFLMNDTLAIIGTPVMLLISRANPTSIPTPKPLLLALAFAVTIGSVTSPIGNPQNLLIAVSGQVPYPFVTFTEYLLLPTLVNLFLAYLLLRLVHWKQFKAAHLEYPPSAVTDRRLARLTKASLAVLFALVFCKMVFVFLSVKFDLKLTYVALAAAAPVVFFSPKRFGIIRRIDWTTLVFFAAMFVLMKSVWDSGFFQAALNNVTGHVSSVGAIFAASIGLSQFISNVPLVALYLPLLAHAGATVKGLMALAAGSTIAGNLTILGAASNVIIIQNAEKKGNQTLTFWEFARVGAPLTLVNVTVYFLFFLLFPG